MPYSSNDQLPPYIRKLPAHAQTVFRAAFNAAFAKYGESRAFAIATAAAERAAKRKK